MHALTTFHFILPDYSHPFLSSVICFVLLCLPLQTGMLSKTALGRDVPSGVYEIRNVCNNTNTIQVHVPFGHIALVDIPTSSKMYAVCNMDTDRGGWMVIQRRIINGSVNFYRNWTQYEEGFGDLVTEFWYGLKNLHCLTTRYKVELRIDLRNANGDEITWVYQNFTVAGPGDKYRLKIGHGQGPGYDSMAPHSNAQFSTYDNDNDGISTHCAAAYKGGWWYHRNSCYGSNLNGPHVKQSTWDYIAWQTTNGWPFFPDVTMMIRPKNCRLTEQSDSPECPEKD